VVSTAIDVSDGLVQDLQHICEASKVGVVLDQRELPVAPALSRASLERDPLSYVLSGGDDYELLFMVGPGKRAMSNVERICGGSGCVVSRIGHVIRADDRPRVVDASGEVIVANGYSHFGGKR